MLARLLRRPAAAVRAPLVSRVGTLPLRSAAARAAHAPLSTAARAAAAATNASAASKPYATTATTAAAAPNNNSAPAGARGLATPVTTPEDPWPTTFAPPAFVKDLTAANLPGWSSVIAMMHDQSRADPNDPSVNPSPDPSNPYNPDDFRPQFFNPLKGMVPKPPAPIPTATITWNAFPRAVKVVSGSDQQRWQTADSNRYRYQDEYCEWSITRRPSDNKITKVSFTSEGPEYWDYLWSVQPDTVLQLYRKYVSPKVQAGDLTVDGTPTGEYNGRNKWNTDSKSGAMHLICPPNSLFAEIKLGADASLPRTRGPGGPFITDTQELIKCAQYGLPTRNSDPTIGAAVNALARQGYMIAFANPVALYMQGIDTTSWITPDGTPAANFWNVDRGQPGRILRATLEVPSNLGYVVGDIQTTPGLTIDYGGQIADFITVFLKGMAADKDSANIQPRSYCEGHKPPSGSFASAAPAAVRTGMRVGFKANKRSIKH